jgi:hypothetical protein
MKEDVPASPGQRAGLCHSIAHLLGLNGCMLERGFRDGHEWLFLECIGCGERKPYIHSRVCYCGLPSARSAPEPSPAEGSDSPIPERSDAEQKDPK